MNFKQLFNMNKKEETPQQHEVATIEKPTLSEGDQAKIATVIIPKTIFGMETRSGLSNSLKKAGINPELVDEAIERYYYRVNHSQVPGTVCDSFKVSVAGIKLASTYQTRDAKNKARGLLIELWRTFISRGKIQIVSADQLAEAIFKAGYKLDYRSVAEAEKKIQDVALNLILLGVCTFKTIRSELNKSYLIEISPKGLDWLKKNLPFDERVTHLPNEYKHTAEELEKYSTAHTGATATPKKELNF